MAKTVNRSNLKKAYRYCRKNGVVPTFYAALERMLDQNVRYEKRIITEEELAAQRNTIWEAPECFSILVPAYETKLQHFHEMIDSVLTQTYGGFELIIADASPSDKLWEELKYYNDSRIRYLKLAGNNGISENTNAALEEAKGSYIGLLDHDDVLEKDALYRMMEAIAKGRAETGRAPGLLYSDEDKCDDTMTSFYEPHFKVGFNLDLLMSNNYICHFLVMEARLMRSLRLRREYDGAQDHDLVLRAVGRLQREEIVHIPHILYHWRCHTGSTSENPESKMYAYEAGKKALIDFVDRMGWKGDVRHNKHLGFYRIEYRNNVLTHRPDLAAVGGFTACRGKIAGGIYKGQPLVYAGYMNRMDLYQNTRLLDIRNMAVNKEYQPVYEEVTGHPYESTFYADEKELPQWIRELDKTAQGRAQIALLSTKLSRRLLEKGGRLLLDPVCVRTVKGRADSFRK